MKSFIFASMITNQIVARKVASCLLDMGAIKLNLQKPFTWASGWKSPIYCDNRLTLSDDPVRRFIKEAMADLVEDKFPDVEGICGVATAGIPQGALIADKLRLPFLYVRAKAKEHGLTKQIEGKIVAGEKIVVIEDLVSTGGSSLRAVDVLRNAGLVILGMVSIFTYDFPVSGKAFNQSDLEFYSLSDYNSLLEIALEKKYIQPDQLEILSRWREDPAGWKNK